MNLSIQYSECGKGYRVGDDRAGTRLRCKACGAVFRVPDVDFEDEASVVLPSRIGQKTGSRNKQSQSANSSSAALWIVSSVAGVAVIGLVVGVFFLVWGGGDQGGQEVASAQTAPLGSKADAASKQTHVPQTQVAASQASKPSANGVAKTNAQTQRVDALPDTAKENTTNGTPQSDGNDKVAPNPVSESSDAAKETAPVDETSRDRRADERRTTEPSLTQAQAIAEIEKLGGRVTVDKRSPDKPVVKVTLRGPKVSDAGLVHLKGLTKLRTLSLDRTQVSDAGLVHLKELTQLRTLTLYNTKVSDAGLVHLKGLTKLLWLDLNNTRVTDAGLVHLKGLTKLQYLTLNKTQVSDAGLVHLKGLTKLLWLGLYFTKVSDAGLVHLKGLTKLRTLSLDNTQVSDAGLVQLKGLTKLQTLGLDNTQVSDAGLVHLKGLTKLQNLTLNKTQVSDVGLVHLKGLTKLQELSLGETQVSDAGLVHLKGLTKLQNLTLYRTQVSDAGLVHLKGLTKLQRLNLFDSQISDAGLVHLKGLTKLQRLNLGDTRVTDAGVNKLKQALPKCNIFPKSDSK